MELKKIEHKLTVCKVKEISNINTDSFFSYINALASKTMSALTVFSRQSLTLAISL